MAILNKIKTLKNENCTFDLKKNYSKIDCERTIRIEPFRDLLAKKLSCYIYKWIVDWNVNMSLFFVIFAHSTVSLHRLLLPLLRLPFVFQLSFTQYYSWNHDHLCSNKSFVKIGAYHTKKVTAKKSNLKHEKVVNWRRKKHAKNEVVCAHFLWLGITTGSHIVAFL